LQHWLRRTIVSIDIDVYTYTIFVLTVVTLLLVVCICCRCATCVDGYYYDAATNTCGICVESKLNPFAAVIVSIVGLIGLITLGIRAISWLGIDLQDIQDVALMDLLSHFLAKLFGNNDEDRVERIRQFMQKCKIYITLGQILSALSFVFNAVPPASFNKLTNVLSILVSGLVIYVFIINLTVCGF
jgi:hypothetical protein